MRVGRRGLARLSASLLAVLVLGAAGVRAQGDAGGQPPTQGSGAADGAETPGTPTPDNQTPDNQNAGGPDAGSAGAAALAAPVRAVRLDASGGPLTLEEAVANAIEAWRRAAPDAVAVVVREDADNRVGYGDPALLGPDTLSLTLRHEGEAGVDIRLAPDAIRAHPAVLLHVVGVLLGLPESADGVMASAIPATDAPDAPTPADVASLEALRAYPPEDLNRDGTVDFYDLVLFGQAFGGQGVNLPADFDGDGRVDEADLTRLRATYGFTAPATQGGPLVAPGGAAPDGATAGAATPSPEAAPPPSDGPAAQDGNAPPGGGTPSGDAAP